MKLSHTVISLLVLVLPCKARINELRSLLSDSTNHTTVLDQPCIQDFTECKGSDCANCCSGLSRDIDDTRACGDGNCYPDGYDCGYELSWNCCNGAYANDGKTCGGECLESGTKCDVNSTCSSCCNNAFWQNEDTYQCGCMDDGTKCIPGVNCDQCCNGAYDDNGYTCGGTCIEDGKECTYGEDCQSCCSVGLFWFSTGKYTCGGEPCYKDGESCIPNLNCWNCCSGGAFNGDGAVCGGTCLEAGAEIGIFSDSSKCCDGLSYWDAKAGSMKCGYTPCFEDGTKCIPGETCNNCCNGAYDDNGTKCGGTCVPDGTKCDYYSTCNLCCTSLYEFNQDTGSYQCKPFRLEDCFDQ